MSPICTFLRNCLLSLFLLLGSQGQVAAASFRPLLTNYTPAEYGLEAGQQNWDCTQDEHGMMYFANNDGLLTYDGYTWQSVPALSHSLIRSVRAIGDRIYYGGYEQFGYLTRSPYGELECHPLTPLLDESSFTNEEPWIIIEAGEYIYFQTFSSLFRYRPSSDSSKDELKKIHNPEFQPLYLHKLGDSLWAQIIDGDYCSFDGEKYAFEVPRMAVGNDNVVALLPIGSGQQPVLVTERHGLFRFNPSDRTVIPFETELGETLRLTSINRAVVTPSNTIILGTLLDGIYAIDSQGKMLWHYNTANGLNNNSVLRLFCDGDNNVWACLDEGICLIRCGQPFSFFRPAPYETALGTVYGLLTLQRELLITTNQGFYTYPLDDKDAMPTLVPGTQGQNWHVTQIDNQLFLGSNASTYYVYPKQGYALQAVPNTQASSTSLKKALIHGQEVLVESSYAELRIYRKPNGVWLYSHSLKDFISPIRQIEIDEKGDIWASNMQKGVYRLTLSPDLTTIVCQHYYDKLSDESESTQCFVMKVGGRIVLSDKRQLYTYDDISQKIIPFDKLNQLLPVTTNIYNADEVGARGVWISGKNSYTLLSIMGDSIKMNDHITATMLGLLPIESSARVYQDGSQAYFNMAGGVVRYEMDAKRPVSKTHPRLVLQEGSYLTSDGESHRINVEQAMQGKRQEVASSMTLLFSYPNLSGNCGSFRITLVGPSQRTFLTDNPNVIFSNLSAGNYALRVDALSVSGEQLDQLSLGFNVLNPWYLRWWALLLYTLIVLLSAYSYGRWRTFLAISRRERQIEKERQEHRIKMLERDRLISEQQKQILETELSSKSKDLASLAMDVYTKEKVIENIKESMQEEIGKGHFSQREIHALLQRIQHTEGNLEFWSIYQKNFDLIHEHFFRNLQKRYPELTTNDLKFCALLRLNLSTKDIAKFTNLSVRGVESARLRLRKKLALSQEQNLVDYLINFRE